MNFNILMHTRLSNISIGPSTMRGQGKEGLVVAMRKCLFKIDLKKFVRSLSSEKKYYNYLNVETEKMEEELSYFGASWGASRKGLNIFFREVVYNIYTVNNLMLSKDIKKLNKMIQHLEVPLDSQVTRGLRKDYKKYSTKKLTSWPGIKHINDNFISDEYQDAAKVVARNEETIRIHLDLKYWRNDKKK